MNLENRVLRYSLIVPALYSSYNIGNEVKERKYDITLLSNRKLTAERNILRAQLRFIKQGNEDVLEGKKEDDHRNFFEYVQALNANIGTIVKKSVDTANTLTSLRVDPLFNATGAVIKDINQVLPTYEGALRLLEAHSKGEVKLEEPQLRELERRIEVTGSIIDAGNRYLEALHNNPQGYHVDPKELEEAWKALFSPGNEAMNQLDQRILARVRSTPIHQTYMKDYNDQRRRELTDLFDRREIAKRLTLEGEDLIKKGLKTEATERYKEAITIDPTFDTAWYNLGFRYAESKDIRTAVTTFGIFLNAPHSGNPRRRELDEKAIKYIAIAQTYSKK